MILYIYSVLLNYYTKKEVGKLQFDSFIIDDLSPIYLQIVEFIKKSIVTGDLKMGEKLPSVREMSSLLGVNQNTLQRAYSELETMGVTTTKRGLGSFIVDDEVKIKSLKNKMAEKTVDDFIKNINSLNMDLEDVIKLLRERVNND